MSTILSSTIFLIVSEETTLLTTVLSTVSIPFVKYAPVLSLKDLVSGWTYLSEISSS